MTAPRMPLADFTEEETARLAAIEAAPAAEESLRERVARAMHEVPAQPGVYGRIPWGRLMEQHREAYRQMASAALAVVVTAHSEAGR